MQNPCETRAEPVLNPLLAKSRNASTARFDDYENSSKAATERFCQGDDGRSHRTSMEAWVPDQYDSSGSAASGKNELPEVLVLCQQYPRFGVGEPKHDLIVDPRIDLDDGCNVVLRVAKRSDDGKVAALVGEKPQRLSPDAPANPCQ